MKQRRKEEDREKGFKRYQYKMRKKAINYKGGNCCICHESFKLVCYDFHYADPSQKDFEPSRVFCKSWNGIKTEIDKCILVCSNCHRILHKEDEYSHLKETPVQTIKIQIELF